LSNEIIEVLKYPKIGVALNHPYIDGFFHEINQAAWGSPMTMETPKF
jgi:hypothetical protein